MIGKMEMDLSELYGNPICNVEMSEDGSLILYTGSSSYNITRVYKLSLGYACKELHDFAAVLNGYDSIISINSIKRYKNVDDESKNQFCYVFSFNEIDQKIIPMDNGGICDLSIIVSEPCFKDLIGNTVSDIKCDDDLLTVCLDYSGRVINLVSYLSESDATIESTYGDIYNIKNEPIVDVTVAYNKDYDLLTKQNRKHISEYYKGPDTLDYTHLDICLKTKSGEFGMIWFLIEYDESYDIHHLKIEPKDLEF